MKLAPDLQKCMAHSWRTDGVRNSKIIAFLLVRKNGRVEDAGFAVPKPTPGAALFLDCVRSAMLRLDLSGVPWEADRKLIFPINTRVILDED